MDIISPQSSKWFSKAILFLTLQVFEKKHEQGKWHFIWFFYLLFIVLKWNLLLLTFVEKIQLLWRKTVILDLTSIYPSFNCCAVQQCLWIRYKIDLCWGKNCYKPNNLKLNERFVSFLLFTSIGCLTQIELFFSPC